MRGQRLQQLKRAVLQTVTQNVRDYDTTLCNRHTVITCDNGMRIDILWSRECYMHLCGVGCNRPQRIFHMKNGRPPSEASYFYSQALAGRLSEDSLVVRETEHLARLKIQALPELNHLPELNLVLVKPTRHTAT